MTNPTDQRFNDPPSDDEPSDLHAERLVLSCLFRAGPDVREAVEKRLTPQHFTQYRPVAEAALSLVSDGKRPDAVTVEKIISDEYTGLLRSIRSIPVEDRPPPRNVDTFVDVLVREYRRRLMQRASDRLLLSVDDDTDLIERIHEAEELLHESANVDAGQGPIPVRHLLQEVYEALKDQPDETVTGIPSGLSRVDERTRGWQDGDLIVIMARPGMGKTSYALKCAYTAAVRHGTPTLIFSLEMPRAQIIQRLMSAASRTPVNMLDRETDTDAFLDAMNRLIDAEIYIDDRVGMTPKAMHAAARTAKRKHGIGLVVIDFLTLIPRPRNVANNARALGIITRRIKRMAKELEIPVLLLSQVNRELENRADPKPKLSDLRGSGEIEETADIVQGIFRPGYYENDGAKDASAESARAEILTLKFRNGPIGTEIVSFVPSYAWFEDLSRRSDPF